MESERYPKHINDLMIGLITSGKMSYREIATALNVRFGTNYTRSSVAGRAFRLGYSTPQENRVLKNVGVVHNPYGRGARLPELVARAELRHDVASPARVVRSTVELCKWPVEGGCQNTAEVCAYCLEHARLAYRVMPTHKRNSVFNKVDELQAVGDAVVAET